MGKNVAPLVVEGLEKRFGPVRALDGVSFSLEEGEVFGYLGPNGAGKTTTLRVILGLVHASAGRVKVLGRGPGDTRARTDIGYLPGELRLYGDMTGRAALDYFAGFRPSRPPVLRPRLLEALELVLSQPISRERYFAGQVVFALASLAVLGLAGGLASWIGQRVYGLDALGPGTLALLAANFFLLQAAWWGVTLLVSVFGREAGRVAFTGFLVALLSYLTQAIAGMWPAAAYLLPYSPNGYYDPRVILKAAALPVKSVAVLGGLAVAGTTLALIRFRRRDIP